MQCREVRDLFDSYLAEELLTETNHEILRHLSGCPTCRADLAERRALREALQRAFARARDLEPRSEFSAELGAKLRDIAQVAPRRGLFSHWLAVAATVVFGVGLAGTLWWTSRFVRDRDLAAAAVGDHRNCALHFTLAEKPISLAEAAQRYDAAYRVLEELPPAEILTSSGAARVLERHSCVYAGRRFAHVVLRYHEKVVSLLVTSAGGGISTNVPLDATLHGESSVDRIDDMSVLSFRSAQHTIFLTGDVNRAELSSLAEVLAGPLTRRLSSNQTQRSTLGLATASPSLTAVMPGDSRSGIDWTLPGLFWRKRPGSLGATCPEPAPPRPQPIATLEGYRKRIHGV
jgi:anti-sigma factor RsiW